MATGIVTLRSAFGSKLFGRTCIDYATLLDIIEFDDSFSHPYSWEDGSGAQHSDKFYVPDPNLLVSSYYEMLPSGGYRIYTKRFSDDITKGEEYYEIKDFDERISDSLSLFLKIKNGKTEDDAYVNIYSLYRLDAGKVFDPSTAARPGVDYRDLTTRATAVLYSLSCRQNRLMEQYIRDIDASDVEQRAIQRVADILKDVQSVVSMADSMCSGDNERNYASLPPEVWSFLVERDLLPISEKSSSDAATSAKEVEIVNAVNAVIRHREDSYSPVESFRAWTLLNALVRHTDLFLKETVFQKETDAERLFVGGKAAIALGAYPEEAVLDPYNPIYWRRASTIDENPIKAVIGVGDHWVFDPRLRNSLGQIINWHGNRWDGKRHDGEGDDHNENCAFFHYFGDVVEADSSTKESPVLKYSGMCNFQHADRSEGDYTISKSGDNGNGSEKKTVGPKTDSPAPDFSVRWYGEKPPKSEKEFEVGLCGILSRRCGNQPFMPMPCFARDGDGATVFSDEFKRFFLGKLYNNRGIGGLDRYVTMFTIKFDDGSVDGGSRFIVDDVQLRYMIPKTSNELSVSVDWSASTSDSNSFHGGAAVNVAPLNFARTPLKGNGTFNDASIWNVERKNGDFWPIVGDTEKWYAANAKLLHKNPYAECILARIGEKTKDVAFPINRLLAISDSVRMYADRISNDNSTRSSQLRQVQQESQQPISTASSLVQAINRTRLGAVSKIK
ncbi:MAG: hypothetical protein LBB38_02005 [Puniceicoccales bacterium]|jgi:hypothetical protein|nr:hypothetical protein [Puniceicoccales bacterium]